MQNCLVSYSVIWNVYNIYVIYKVCVHDYTYTVNLIDVQDEFCLGEDNTEEAVESLLLVSVNITRSSPACGSASISLNLLFKSYGKNLCKCTVISPV